MAGLNQEFGEPMLGAVSEINDGFGDKIEAPQAHNLGEVSQGFGNATLIQRLGETMTAEAKGISHNSLQLEATHPSIDYYDF